MRSVKRILIGMMVLALTITGCVSKQGSVSVPTGAQAGDLVNLEACTYEQGGNDFASECGHLVVRENWENSDSRLITVPVMRILATGNARYEPIFNLNGGPGNTNMSFGHISSFIENHDIVLVGYRGVDGSVNLHCPEVVESMQGVNNDLLSKESIVHIGNAFTECGESLQAQGIDLNGYTIPNIVTDLEAARTGFGYEQINLLSGSFGTRIAMIYAWMFPDSINRSAMISVNPPGHLAWEPELLDWQIAYDADLCAQDMACSARTDDLAESVRGVVQDMPNRWLFMKIDPGRVRFFTHFFLWYRGGLTGQDSAMIYDAYLAAAEGDPSGLALISLMYDLINPAAMMNWGQSAAMVMSSDFDSERNYFSEMNPSGSIIGAPQSELAWSPLQFTEWPSELISSELRQVQPSDVETLLISGSVDATTPARYATDELLPYLDNGQQVILSEFGHSNDIWDLQPEATMHLLTTFFISGVGDDSLFVYQPMDFEVGLGFPAIAKILVVAIILIFVLMALLIRHIVRRDKRRQTKSSLPN